MTIFFVAIMVEWTYTVGPITIDTIAGTMVGSYGATITELVSLSSLINVTSGVLFIVGTLLVRRTFRG